MFKIENNDIVNIMPEYMCKSTWYGHAPFAFLLMELIKPKLLVELGTQYGFSYFTFCQAVAKLNLEKKGTKCFAIDSWQGDKHATYSDSKIYENVIRYNEKYKHFSSILKGYFDEFVNKFDDGSIDILHIDGFHTYDAVKHDFNTWFSKVSGDGVILLHDTNVIYGKQAYIDEKYKDFGVYKFFEEIKNKYLSLNFYHSHGLGVICKSDKTPIKLTNFISYAQKNNYFVQNFFENNSKRIELEFAYSNEKLRTNELRDKLNNIYISKFLRLENKLIRFRNRAILTSFIRKFLNISKYYAGVIPRNNNKLFLKLQENKFSFLDLGCSNGDSIQYCENIFKYGNGLGVDIALDKIIKARKKGYNVIKADITSEQFPEKSVSFISMMDFLEHLKNKSETKKILNSAGKVTRDFIFIRHPSFEDIEYLKAFNLKLDWTDWHGQPNMLLMEDFRIIFQELGWDEYIIIPKKLILNSKHNAIIPFDSPTDTIRYNRTLGVKKEIKFDKAVWSQFDIFIKINKAMNKDKWDTIINSTS